MHFCPRPSCRRAYHQSCLLAGKHKESSSAANLATIHAKPSAAPLRSARKHASPVKKVSKTTTAAPPASAASSSSPSSASRALRLLACSPDTDDNVDLESLVALTMVQVSLTNDDDASDVEKPPKKKRRGRPSKIATAEPASPVEVRAQPVRALADTLADLPPLLLQVAQQPMVRGAAFKPGGVSGNIGFVTRARRLVYQILEGSSLPEDWEAQVFGVHKEVELGAENAVVKITGARKPLPLIVCPKCRSAI